MVYGLTIYGVGSFLGVIGIEIVPLELEWGFQESSIVVFIWCSAMQIHPHISACLHPRRIGCVRVYMLVLFGCRFDLFDFSHPSVGFA